LRSRPGAASVSRCSATGATTSKYSHHSAAAITTPSAAAATMPASGSTRLVSQV